MHPGSSRRRARAINPENTMSRRSIMATATVAAAIGALGGCAATGEVASAERPDCPGKIVCPITGELICADECPVGAGAKPDAALAMNQTRPCCAAK